MFVDCPKCCYSLRLASRNCSHASHRLASPTRNTSKSTHIFALLHYVPFTWWQLLRPLCLQPPPCVFQIFTGMTNNDNKPEMKTEWKWKLLQKWFQKPMESLGVIYEMYIETQFFFDWFVLVQDYKGTHDDGWEPLYVLYNFSSLLYIHRYRSNRSAQFRLVH